MNLLLAITTAALASLLVGALLRPPSRRAAPDDAQAAATRTDDGSPWKRREWRRRPPRRHATRAWRLSVVGLAVLAGGILAVAGVVAWWAASRAHSLGSRRRSARAVARAIPEATERLVLLVEAGLPPLVALHQLGETGGAVGAAAREVVRRTERGERLADALDALPDQLGPAAAPLRDGMALAERHGAPLTPVLRDLAAEARRQRRRDADAFARTLPVRLSVPLVVCTLPGFVLVSIVPTALGTLSSLRGLSI